MAKRAAPIMPSAPVMLLPDRTLVLDGRVAAQPSVSVTPGAPAARLSLRAPHKSRAALSRALGLKLPEAPMSTAVSGKRAALWLGPDEWLVIDDTQADLAALFRQVSAPHSAVDVSHRNQAIMVAGQGAAAALNAGCPRDLSLAAFPAGAASRTVLGKAEIVLWRVEAEIFRVECWRSFADYCFTLLTEGARDAAI